MIFSLCAFSFFIPQTKQLTSKLHTLIIVINVLIVCYVIYVAYILIREFSPRAIQHLCAILSLMFFASVIKFLKNCLVNENRG